MLRRILGGRGVGHAGPRGAAAPAVAAAPTLAPLPLRSSSCHTPARAMGGAAMPGAMHQPGESGQEPGSSSSIAGKETWGQFGAKMRHGRRRIRVIDVAAKMSYEYQMLKRMCKRRPAMRQWAVRDDFCDMSPGVVVMSPSMQAAFMKVFRLKDKGRIRRCLRDIVPIIEYRNREERPAAMRDTASDMIPDGEPDTLNQKKRELFERRETGENFKPLYLHDKRSQAKLRFKIRQRLIKFQRQLAIANAVASRTVLYSTDDAIGYFLFRGAAMYSGMHRVFFELSKQLPHFAPKSMLDFGAGTGTAILVAKEVYDPGALAYPLYRSMRQTMTGNVSAQAQQLRELRYDLRRLSRNNTEKRKARFMAVAALLERGEVDAADLPADLRREIAQVAANAAENKKRRLVSEAHARHRDVVDGTDWTDGDPLGEAHAAAEDPSGVLDGEDDDDGGAADGGGGGAQGAADRTWWERLVDLESATVQERASRRLQPLQEVTAIEPSPGMMEIGTMVLHDDVPNVAWKRYLLPEDEAVQHDLVVAAYSLSEVADAASRTRLVQQLWKMTRGVLVLVEFSNLHNFNLLMEARDRILEEKGVGLWDWQPTIVAPCPHEQRCPLRHCKAGVKRKRMRLCTTEAHYRATFIDVWARHMPLKVGIEPISYMIFARNELVPERAERREALVRQEEAQRVRERDATQRDLYKAALSLKDVVFDRLSDEALHRPSTGVPAKLSDTAPSELSPIDAVATTSASERGQLPTDAARVVQMSAQRYNKLIYPRQYPPATHTYNRAFVDAGYQRQRAITPSEVLVVREELEEMRRRVTRVSPSYLRLIRDPTCRGKVQACFCTPDGDLVTARVYRRFYGDHGSAPRHATLRWQHVGGWKLLRRIRSGSLFPHDVPLYAVARHPQVDFPNTLVDVRHSAVEKTAMQYNDPMTLLETPEEELTRDEVKVKRRMVRDEEMQKKAEAKLEEVLGTKIQHASLDGHVDARRRISAEEWARAVRHAKHKTVRHTERTIPNAAKLRAAKRSLEVRHRNVWREMKQNRRR
ncbi:Mitochondrial small ribosomal subunit Rsm22 [Novymonas esmeraldas]|uniref:Mitochondrial small ribosomal subunit Rsm22 n=1 Tax=Novymonas esmeraldas TaxID=1808958 RepID=A0AAW0EPW6_9TRYP